MTYVRLRLASIVLAASLAPALTVVTPAHAAALPNCAVATATPCFEVVWVNGKQVRMTFLDLAPAPSPAPTSKFYVTAVQTRTPQGTVPFLHDHTAAPPKRDGHRATGPVRYHGFFVLCGAQGIASGGCVPTTTAIPGLGTIPLARTVHRHRLDSGAGIEAAVRSGLVVLFDTGGTLIASIPARGDDR